MAAALSELQLNNATKELVRKYCDQDQQLVTLKKQLNSLQSRATSLEEEKQGVRAEKDKEKDMADSLVGLERELKKRLEDSIAEAKEKDAKEVDIRTELTQKFQDDITRITGTMEDDAAKQVEAVNENKRLKSKLAMLSQQMELKGKQYEQLLKTREVELQLSKAKADHMTELARTDKLRIDAQQQQLEKEKVALAELEKQHKEVVERFSELQGAIVKSNNLFQEYKVEMDRSTSKVKALSAESGELQRKRIAKQKPLDQALLDLEAQRKKYQQLEKAGTGVQGLLQYFQQARDDFEAWKASNPEQFAKAQREVEEQAAK